MSSRLVSKLILQIGGGDKTRFHLIANYLLHLFSDKTFGLLAGCAPWRGPLAVASLNNNNTL